MTPPSRPIRIHGLDDALAAAAAARALGLPLTLVAGGYGGALWLLGIAAAVERRCPGVAVTAVLDCGDRAGEAQGALAAGIRHALFTGPPETAVRLAAIAAGHGATLLTALPPALDPRGIRNREAACRAWLSSQDA
ncbi:hypothetical protein J2847_000279 [Azospirillum agricola]|uniref:hypothetical protein n=1 Tax=Azospirillum agricola TaxID=1720247 RepID=UPI001AEA0F43|nr:hypothetical protein [Azospirillum agricola]MBP2227012.1 hypothetical protein [Azospirillum agricola]